MLPFNITIYYHDIQWQQRLHESVSRFTERSVEAFLGDESGPAGEGARSRPVEKSTGIHRFWLGKSTSESPVFHMAKSIVFFVDVPLNQSIF